jgi:membrane-bound lytic murein transglycosylase B
VIEAELTARFEGTSEPQAAGAMMVQVFRRGLRLLTSLGAFASLAALTLVACGGGPSTAPPSAAPSTDPQSLSARLSANDVALRRGLAAWRAGDRASSGAPPDEVVLQARYVQRAARLLARRPRLRAATLRRLPSRLAREIRELSVAARDLGRLSAGWRPHRVRLGSPRPLAELLGYYRAAHRRFGVGWNVLAAVHLVESAFGRVRSESVAGAQGPMQFMPATWRAYGLGGDVRDSHDAILGAANLLSQAGAPERYARALYAYNPSPLYVDAVRRYARVMARDRDAVYFLYCWRG